MDKDILCIPKPPFYQVGVERVEDSRYAAQSLNEMGVWKDRAGAETNESYTQVIPYILVLNGSPQQGQVSEILAAERLTGGNEARLHSRVTLGFGGHVKRIGTSTPWEAVQVSIRQELREELGVRLKPDEFPTLLGMIHDDSEDVGRVHTGLVFAAWTSQFEEPLEEISSKEPEKLRTLWLDRVGLGLLHDRFENWALMMTLTMERWGIAPS